MAGAHANDEMRMKVPLGGNHSSTQATSTSLQNTSVIRAHVSSPMYHTIKMISFDLTGNFAIWIRSLRVGFMAETVVSMSSVSDKK